MLFATMFTLGLFASIYHPAGVSLITHHTNPENRTMALGYHGIFGSVGIAVGPFLAGIVLSWGATWRQYYLVLTLPGMMLAMLLLLRLSGSHEPSYDVWKKSGHAKAYQTLLEANPPRIFDPECVSCHVIGWHPTKYFPYEGGYTTQQETPHLIDVGCETCHGPGGAHVEAEMGGDLALQEKLQKAMVITKEESQQRQCVTCHDLDNSPDFDFDLYWPHVEHYEAE